MFTPPPILQNELGMEFISSFGRIKNKQVLMTEIYNYPKDLFIRI